MTERASDWDREYMARLGRYKEEANRAALEAHLALSPLERLYESIRMMQWGRGWGRWDLVRDDPSPLYERAKALGIYEP